MNEMTNEQINQAVAECCGWKVVPAPNEPDFEHLLNASGRLMCSASKINQRHWSAWVTRYTESRDAMAGALETLSEEEWRRFIDLLWVEIGSPALKKANNLNDIVGDLFVMFKAFLLATPLQACRAFLKAKGKL